MMSLIIIHAIICILLIAIILVQAGRGGGLIDTFSGVESMFGTKTNSFLTRTTTTLAILFFITCLSLAFLSAKQSRSLMGSVRPQEEPPKAVTAVTQAVQEEAQEEPTDAKEVPPAQ